MSKGPEFVGGEGPFRVRIPNVRPPKRLVGWAVLIALASVFVIVFFKTMFVYVRPHEYGIKQVNIVVSRGIQKDVYEAGYAFLLPFNFHEMHMLPRHVHVLELTPLTGTEAQSFSTESVHYDRPAKIQTSDGFFVDVDVTILYRIVDPYLVVVELGPDMQYRDQGILPRAEPILKQTLGQLTTEEFYNSPKRVEKAELAKEMLNKELEPKGMQVDRVLIRYFKYSEEIQDNIEKKKLQDQLVYTNQSARKAAEEEKFLTRATEEGIMQVKVVAQEGDSYRVTKEAEKELYVRTREAEADLLVQLAEAKRTELRNAAMQGAGSDRMVAMKMAEVLNGLEAIMMPAGGVNGVNPLKLDDMLTMFGLNLVEIIPTPPQGAASPAPPPAVETPAAAPVAPPAGQEEVAQ